ncbi:MAG: CHRD domain-containing protein [Candidatus Peribacteraceae bacterium]|nr:CHRD domain-containing protein [Candidatus Peribacteraceae bacterium]
MVTSSLFLHRRVLRFPAAIAGTALLLGSVMPAMAQQTSYTDVPAGAYYEAAASALLDIGALDSKESRLRPGDLATRAELVKLLVNLTGETLLYPSSASFNDVSRSTWFFPYFEAAAHVGWVHGDGDCYQKSRPCTARPGDTVNRAEAAALLMRGFALEHTGTAPQFPDNSQGQWYYTNIQTAADHCVLQGDSMTGRVRPGAAMNRAEMVVMFHRAYLNMEYGADCGTVSANISGVTSLSPTRVRVTFDSDMNEVRAEDESRYDVVRVSGGGTVDVETATMVNGKVIDLELSESLSAGATYTLTVSNLLTSANALFSDSERFTSDTDGAGEISGVTAVTAQRIRLTFDTDVNATRMEDEARYVVARVGGAGNIAVRTATHIDNRTVDLDLNGSLTTDASYLVSAQNMQTSGGVVFSDSITFPYPTSTGDMTEAVALSSNRIRMTFDSDLDRSRAEDESRYTVERVGVSGALDIRNAVHTGNRTVELELTNALAAGGSYRVSGQSLMTSGGVVFSDSMTFVFATTPGMGRLTKVEALSSTSVRLTFDTELDAIRAEQSSRYGVTDGSRSLLIRTANLTSDNRTVELDLIESMTSQRSYTVNVLSMLTAGGSLFSDSGTVVFDSGTAVNLRATLTGSQEIPAMITTATGSGTFVLSSNGLHYDIAVKGFGSGSMAITAAHFHLGEPGVSGAVVQPITFSNNHSVGDWTGLTDALRNAILNGSIYVNVHTAAHPDGEIRGQVLKQ